jgi:hypothetical protein
MSGMTRPEVNLIVNRYIGVSGGYLGDFSYRTHAEFYPEDCDLDIDPSQMTGTTRERFITILERADPLTQARIIRGVLHKYPVGSSEVRTPELHVQIAAIAERLELSGGIVATTPKLSSDLVSRAIVDAETLLRTTGAPSGVDRMHTAFHGFLKVACATASIPHSDDPSITELYKTLRVHHPALRDAGPHAEDIDRIIKSFAAAVDSLNTLRNRASVAHPNEQILNVHEASLYINAVRTLMAYLDGKMAEAPVAQQADLAHL